MYSAWNHLEDVKTDPAALVNIGMVDGSGELNVGRPERIPEIKQLKILKELNQKNDEFLRCGKIFTGYFIQEETKV